MVRAAGGTAGGAVRKMHYAKMYAARATTAIARRKFGAWNSAASRGLARVADE